jgi:hypothetical protein
MPYKVYIDDNFHYQDTEHRYEYGTYQSLEEAVTVARRIVDEFLEWEYRSGMSANDLYDQYVSFGEDPFIVPDERVGEGVIFSAWDYAKQRCADLCK